MLIRLLLIFSLMLSSSVWASTFGNAKPLSAQEAILVDSEPNDSQLVVNFTMADNIYLYRDKIKLTLSDSSLYTHSKFEQTPTIIQDPSFGEMAVFFENATLLIDRSQLPADTQTIKLRYQGCDKAIGLCYPPQNIELAIEKAAGPSASQTTSNSNSAAPSLENAGSIQAFLLEAGVLVIIATFLIFGIGLTFTPCVLPMVPILSSVIAGQSNLTPRKGFIMSSTYVFGMALTFAIAGTVVGLMGARFNLQIYMQQPVVLSVFAGLFVLLAMAMFGFYELRLPRFIQDPLDRLNQKQQGGSLISVFLMGALSAVVVSPCVSAPLAGALMFISTTGDAALGGMALFALGLGMGLPLIAIGTTGASMLPKAGAWMDQVKYFFGVLLLAVALWVLGRVLPEDIYIGAWVVLIGVYAVVLGAFETATTSKQRIVKGLALLAFIVAATLLVKLVNPSVAVNTNVVATGQIETNTAASKDAGFFQTVTTEAELNAILESAKQDEKLVFVDIYAKWCIECKIMENTLFADAQVQNELDNFVRIKLDITEFDEFHKRFLEQQQIFGPPALMFYGLDGNIINEALILGEISKPNFLQHLGQFDH